MEHMHAPISWYVCGTHRGDRKRGLDRRSDRDRNNDFGSRNDRDRNDRDRERDRDRDRDRDRERDSSPPPAKRKPETKSVFSRLSGPPSSRDDDIKSKPKLNSRIIRELPTKEEIVEAQGSDPASRARNRRMFGSLLGTLQKFCQEESRLKQKEQKKAQIEKKLEDQQIQEREIMKKERQNLYNTRKRQQMEIKMLENKMNLMKEFGTWEESKKPLMNFIRTKTKPRIHYLPKVLDKRTERKLEECKRDIESKCVCVCVCICVCVWLSVLRYILLGLRWWWSFVMDVDMVAYLTMWFDFHYVHKCNTDFMVSHFWS